MINTQNHNNLISTINTETMVIRSSKGSLRTYIDGLLTLLAWGIFLYLLADIFINWENLSIHSVIRPLDISLSDVAICITLVAMQSGSLLLWAFYNRIRFKGKKRRASKNPILDQEFINKFSVDQISLEKLRNSSISIIHHSKEGTIQKISSTVN